MRHRALVQRGAPALLVAVAVAAVTLGATAAHAQVAGRDVWVMRGSPQPPRAWLGFSYVYTDTRGPTRSVEIQDVRDGSPAAKAGLRAHDVVVKINGLAATPQLMASLSGALQPGQTVNLTIRRKGAQRNVRVVAAAPPKWLRREYAPFAAIVNPDSIRREVRIYLDSARRVIDTMHFPHLDSMYAPHFRIESTDSGLVYVRPNGRDTIMRFFPDHRGSALFDVRGGMPRLDLRIDSLVRPDELLRMQIDAGMRSVAGAEFTIVNPDLGEYFGVPSGLLVTRVAPSTPAAQAGLLPGDVVVRVGGEAVSTVQDLRDAVTRSRGRTLKLDIVRKRHHQVLELRLE